MRDFERAVSGINKICLKTLFYDFYGLRDITETVDHSAKLIDFVRSPGRGGVLCPFLVIFTMLKKFDFFAFLSDKELITLGTSRTPSFGLASSGVEILKRVGADVLCFDGVFA